MRKKEEILKDVRMDILDDDHTDLSPLWVQHRKIEVLIDIRDILNSKTEQIAAAQKNILDNL